MYRITLAKHIITKNIRVRGTYGVVDLCGRNEEQRRWTTARVEDLRKFEKALINNLKHIIRKSNGRGRKATNS